MQPTHPPTHPFIHPSIHPFAHRALRAAEHCDISSSESAAIAWIIEKMELEQSKMDDMEGDSRWASE